MKRLWRGRPRGLSELPGTIREAGVYNGSDFYLDKATLSQDGKYYRLLFEGGAVHFWGYTDSGNWVQIAGDPYDADGNVVIVPTEPPDVVETPKAVGDDGFESIDVGD